MITSLIDELKRRGWTDDDFNYVGPFPPYVRIGVSYMKWEGAFEPMKRRRWRKITVSSVLSSKLFKIDLSIYADQLSARWIDYQEHFPFDDWVIATQFGLTNMRVRPRLDRREFIVSFGALINAQGVLIDV